MQECQGRRSEPWACKLRPARICPVSIARAAPYFALYEPFSLAWGRLRENFPPTTRDSIDATAKTERLPSRTSPAFLRIRQGPSLDRKVAVGGIWRALSNP